MRSCRFFIISSSSAHSQDSGKAIAITLGQLVVADGQSTEEQALKAGRRAHRPAKLWGLTKPADCFCKLGVLFVGVLIINKVLLFGVYIRASAFWLFCRVWQCHGRDRCRAAARRGDASSLAVAFRHMGGCQNSGPPEF